MPKAKSPVCIITFIEGPIDGHEQRFVDPPPETIKMNLGRSIYRMNRLLGKNYRTKLPHYEFVHKEDL